MAGLPFGGNGGAPEADASTTGTPDKGSQAPSKRESKKATKQQQKYGVFDPNELKKGRGLFGFLSTGGGKLTVIAVILAIGAGVGVYAYTADSSAQIEQLVLKTDMPANTLVTTNDVQPVMVPADSVTDPSLLITLPQIQSNLAYTKVALKPNTVLTVGSIGSFSRLSNDLPDGYQLVSITVDPANAAGGSVAAGDIVDIFGSNGGDASSSVFVNGMKGIKVVDVIVAPKTVAQNATTDPTTGQSTVGADSPDLKSGIGSVYKLQVLPEQAADIARAVTSGTDFFLVLTKGVSLTQGEQPVEVQPIPDAVQTNPLLDNPVTDTLDSVVNGNPIVPDNGATADTGVDVVTPDGGAVDTVNPDAGTQGSTAPVNPNTAITPAQP